MSDGLDFERRLAERLRAHSAGASRPFDAAEIARQTVVAGAGSRGSRSVGWPTTIPPRRWLVAGLLLALGLLGAVAGAGSLRRSEVPPVIEPSNGWMAFSAGVPHVRGQPAYVYLVREGVEPQPVGRSDGDPRREVCPTFSPDGNRLAYAEASGNHVPESGQWATHSLVIVDQDAAGDWPGRVERFPVPGGEPDACPVWSPDGRHIAHHFAGQNDLAITPVDGGATRVIRPPNDDANGNASFAWSPDGTVIAVARPSSGIWLIATDDVQQRLLRAGSFHNVSWSPDGSRLLGLEVEPSGLRSSVRVIELDDPAGDVDLGAGSGPPLWSPRLDRIVYMRDQGPGPTAIVVVDPDGTDAHVIPVATVSDGSDDDGGGVRVVWSPDPMRLLCSGCVEGSLLSISATGDPANVLISTRVPAPYTSISDVSMQPLSP